jgi:hypothetical protein
MNSNTLERCMFEQRLLRFLSLRPVSLYVYRRVSAQ